MNISLEERHAIQTVIQLGKRFGYGNLIAHLQTAWARLLVEQGMDEATARAASTGGRGMPFAMQDDLVRLGQWDETGKRYREAR